MRIASLLPSATEILFALGLDDEIVGVSPECDYPPAARGKVVLSRNLITPEMMSQGEIDGKVVEHLRDGGSLYHVDDRLLEEAAPPVWYALALLNSRLLDFVFRRGSARHANGFYAANRQFVAPLPIRVGSTDVVESLSTTARKLAERHTAVQRERQAFRDWLAGRLGARRALPEVFERYEAHGLDDLLAILRRERRRFAEDPETRSFRDLFQREVSLSRERLLDQLRSIRSLELDADAAVYDLFELSSEERALVDAEYDTSTDAAG